MPSFFLEKSRLQHSRNKSDYNKHVQQNPTAKYYLPKLQTTNHISQNTHKLIKNSVFWRPKNTNLEVRFTAPQFTKMDERVPRTIKRVLTYSDTHFSPSCKIFIVCRVNPSTRFIRIESFYCTQSQIDL